MIKLNPCAKCGGEAKTYTIIRYPGYVDGYYVQCYKCGQKTRNTRRTNVAKKAWNAANPINPKEAETHE